jgi:hypothetical protein
MGKAQKSSSPCYEAPGRLLRDGEAARKEINVGGAPAALGLWAATGMYVREKVKKRYGEGGARGVTFYTVRKGWARRWWSSGSGVL